MKGDLHMHSNSSDGVLSSPELVKIAKEKNIDIIAITDHDTTAGIDLALEMGQKLGVKVIPGIELSTNFKGESIHILGYFRDHSYKSNNLLNFLNEMKEKRKNRAKEMVEKIKEIHNINISYEDILQKAKGIIARPHIAKAIVDAGYDYSWDYIFDNIIGNDCPAYIPSIKLPTGEGIDLLKRNNALVVLAHPTIISEKNLQNVLEFNFDGLEAIYPEKSINKAEKFRNIAKKKGIFVTAGSDFHGELDVGTKHNDMGTVTLKDEELNVFLSELKMENGEWI